MSNIAQTLTIAGSDSGGGAGIQADLKTFQMQGVFGTSVITAVTAQNTLGVFDIHPIPLKTIQAQLEAVKNDFQITSAKIGMLGTADIIECVADFLSHRPFDTLVVDPVMIAKGGAPLLQQQAVSALIKYLLPLADVITPNIPEAEALTGIKISDTASIQQAALDLQKQGAKNVIIKGGHSLNSKSQQCQDWILLQNGENFVLESRVSIHHILTAQAVLFSLLNGRISQRGTSKKCGQNSQRFYYGSHLSPIEYWSWTWTD